MYDRGASGVIINDSKTFGLKNLKLMIVGRRCVAPNGGSVGEYRTDQCLKLIFLCFMWKMTLSTALNQNVAIMFMVNDFNDGSVSHNYSLVILMGGRAVA